MLKIDGEVQANPVEKSSEEPSLSNTGEDCFFAFLTGPDVRVRVDRLDETKKYQFHGYLEQHEASEQKLNNLFGGGSYRVQLTQRSNENGRWIIKGTRVLSLPGAYRLPRELPGCLPVGTEEPRPAVPTILGDGGRESGSISPNEALSHALVNQVLDMMKNNQVRPAGPTFDWTPIILAGLGIVKEVMAVKKVPSESPEMTRLTQQLEDMRTQLVQLREKGPASNAIGDAVAAIRELITVRDLITSGGVGGGGEEKEDGMMMLGGRVLDMLQQQGAAGRIVTAPPTQPVTLATGREAPMELWQLMLRQFGGHLVNAAVDDANAEETADAIYGLMPTRRLPVLEGLVANPNAVGLILREVPRLQPYGEWVTTLVGHLKTIIAEVASGDGDELVDPDRGDDPS